MSPSLVFLLVLSLFTCQGMAQDGSPASSILPTTMRQKNIEAPQEVSCPDPTDIEPCECTLFGDLGLTIDCSTVQDEEELRKVFSAFFPTTELYSFKLWDNKGVKILEEGVFGNVSFQMFDVYIGVLDTVETDALTPSLSTLTDIWIQFTKLETFPFERLAEFTSLRYLSFFDNNIHTLPPLSSTSLQYVSFSYNLLTHLPPDVFTDLTVVGEVYITNNHLTEIPAGAFTGLPHLELVHLQGNNISYLQSLTFELVSSPSSNTILHLTDNNIDYVEVDTFKGVAVNATIRMVRNALTRLPEEVWRPVLEKHITVEFSGNDLACGCDVAWLIRDLQLLTLATDAHCADGTLLISLEPADFDVCG